MPEPTTVADPIAIIGIGCRLPGGAVNSDSCWQMLMGGVDAISEVTPDHWDHRFYYVPEQDTSGKTHSLWADLDQARLQLYLQYFARSGFLQPPPPSGTGTATPAA
jgi:hypothetical protein